MLENSYWSYKLKLPQTKPKLTIPLKLILLEIRQDIKTFLVQGPYSCDTLTHEQHNDHHLIETNHFTDSYCNIVLETHFDADGSGGAFLTEKTFKAIKHGQPFVVVGCQQGSLAMPARARISHI
jgi:hypothetical protein